MAHPASEVKPPPASAGKRDESIFALRGIAVLLLVTYHASKSGPEELDQLIDLGWWGTLLDYGGDIRMPLFTVLSGFVYAMRPLKAKSGYAEMLVGKSKRLLLPFLVVGSIYFVWQVVGPGDIVKTEIGGIGHFWLYGDEGPYWFLQAVFWCFVVTAALDAFGAIDGIRGWATVTCVAVLAYVLPTLTMSGELFNYASGLWLLPFFLFGLGLRRFPSVTLSRWTALSFALLVAGLAARVALDEPAGDSILGRAAALCIGAGGIWLLFRIRRRIPTAGLAFIGQYSFSIFLFHTFALTVIYNLFPRVGLENPWMLLIVALPFAIGTAIVFERWLGRYPLVSWPFLGQKPRRPVTRPAAGSVPATERSSV